MRAVRYHEYGDPSVLRVEDVERPSPGRDEVQVRVEAAGVNPVDGKMHDGRYSRKRGDTEQLPRTPGTDVAGVVEATGKGVSGFSIGDRVFGTGLHRTRRFGSYAEYVSVPVEVLARLPSSVPFGVGAAAGVVGVTALRALVDRGEVRRSDTCLIHGGSGGVGHVAVQLADRYGDTVLATAGSDETAERVLELGADAVLRYDRRDLESAIEAEAPQGVDLILDHRCDEYAEIDLAVISPEGRIAIVSGDEWTLDAPVARRKELTVHHVSMSNLAAIPELPSIASVLERIGELLSDGSIGIDIHREYDLAAVGDAHRALEAGGFAGKLIVRP